MRINKIAIAAFGVALTIALTGGAGTAQAAAPVSASCAAANQEMTFAKASLGEAVPTRTRIGNQVTSQKAARQSAINSGNVELVGQINTQLGSSTAMYNTTDGAVATAEARLNRAKTARYAAC